MNTIAITERELTIEPRGLDKLWGFRRQITVPLEHVRGATFDSGVAAEPTGLRAPGLSLPGKHVGTFRRDGEVTFWNVSDPSRNVVIEFVDEPFDRAVLTVDDPRAVEAAINAALA